MLVTFYCENCHAKLRINADAMGSDLVCPECDRHLEVPRMQLGPGFVVGGFLILEKLGQGGMGEVYLARQLSLEREVALKILPSRFTRENSFVVRFLKEVHYQARLDHPNIVTAYDAGEDNGVYFMAMAYVKGETLEEWLVRNGSMSEKEALQVVRQVASALQYASEEKGILHRDIKPANIMLTASLHAKVLDMGLSKNILEQKSTTLVDTLMGTPNYMSPEQIEHPQNIDTRSDMFSLGMTLYNMLTGQIPFEDTGYLKTLNRHATEQLEDPRNLMPGISAGAARLLARMLARDPADRYPNWLSMLEDLQGVLRHTRLPAPPAGPTSLRLNPPPPPRRKGKGVMDSAPKVRPARRPLGILASIGIGLLLGLLGIRMLSPAPTPPPLDPEPLLEIDLLKPPLPSPPTPEPTLPPVDLAVLQRELSGVILDYERRTLGYDAALARLLEIGTLGAGTDIAEAAAQQIVRVRRERDEALNSARNQFRDDTIRILYEQGAQAARDYLQNYDGAFQEEVQSLSANLQRRIRIWEQQERTQREEELRQAEHWLGELRRQVSPLILKREWPRALAMIHEAAEEPALFPVAEQVATLRKEVTDLQSVPTQILDSYAGRIHQEVQLKLQDRNLQAQIRALQPDGLLVARTVYSDEGNPQGSVELFVPFSTLSREELMDQLQTMEGPEYDIYRALISQRAGLKEDCRKYLERAATALAISLRDEIFPLPVIPVSPETAAPPLDSPFNRPRFVP